MSDLDGAFKNWDGYSRHASIQSIGAMLAIAEREAQRAAGRVRRLADLESARMEQIKRGTWPPATQETPDE